MENREDEIVESFIERAEEEKNNLLIEIERLEKETLPIAGEDSINAAEAFTEIARQLNVNFEADTNVEEIISSYMSKLKILKTELEKLEINEGTLLEETVIEKAQKVIPLIERSLLEAKSNLYNSSKINLLSVFKQKRSIESQITDLEKQKMYLQGRLENVWSRKKKREIQQEIEGLDVEIGLLKSKLTGLDFEENMSFVDERMIGNAGQQKNKNLGNEEVGRTRATR